MGKSTISMAIFNSYVKLPEGIPWMVIGSYFLGMVRKWMVFEHPAKNQLYQLYQG